MSAFEEKLIQSVKDCEIMYNKRCSGYKNTSVKSRKWEEISISLNTNAEECIRRWKSLRDRYTRELKIEILPSGSGAKRQAAWHLFASMDFLRDHVAPRRTSGNMGTDENNGAESGEENTEIENLVLSSSNSPPNSPTPTPSSRKRQKLEDINRSFTDGMATFQDFIKSKMATPSSGQEFGQTVANMFDTLNPRHQKEAQIHITKYLVSLQEKELLEGE